MQQKKAGIIKNVFSKDQILDIYNVLQKINDSKNLGQFYAYTNGFEKKDPIYLTIKRMVLDKLEEVFQTKLHLTHGMLLKEQIPWYIHTDYIKKDKTPEGAFLIPLITGNTYTVVFNEECIDSFENYMKNNKKIVGNAKNLYDTMCSHETIDRLEYVSLLGAFKWEAGSVIYWNRKLLHCSDNFIQNGLTEKIALVLFTNND